MNKLVPDNAESCNMQNARGCNSNSAGMSYSLKNTSERKLYISSYSFRVVSLALVPLLKSSIRRLRVNMYHNMADELRRPGSISHIFSPRHPFYIMHACIMPEGVWAIGNATVSHSSFILPSMCDFENCHDALPIYCTDHILHYCEISIHNATCWKLRCIARASDHHYFREDFW